MNKFQHKMMKKKSRVNRTNILENRSLTNKNKHKYSNNCKNNNSKSNRVSISNKPMLIKILITNLTINNKYIRTNQICNISSLIFNKIPKTTFKQCKTMQSLIISICLIRVTQICSSSNISSNISLKTVKYNNLFYNKTKAFINKLLTF